MTIDTLFKLYYHPLFNYAKSITKDVDEAHDAVQQVFIKINAKLLDLKDEQKIKSWLFTITKNTIYDFMRSKKKFEPISDIHIPEEFPDENINDLISLWIQESIQEFPKEEQEILYQSEILGVNQKELAKSFNLPYSTLKSKIQRAREKIRKNLTECCTIIFDKNGNALDYYKNKCKSC
jgi:RNA polymerase sigma-70 factor (ECF subfamily)